MAGAPSSIRESSHPCSHRHVAGHGCHRTADRAYRTLLTRRGTFRLTLAALLLTAIALLVPDDASAQTPFQKAGEMWLDCPFDTATEGDNRVTVTLRWRWLLRGLFDSDPQWQDYHLYTRPKGLTTIADGGLQIPHEQGAESSVMYVGFLDDSDVEDIQEVRLYVTPIDRIWDDADPERDMRCQLTLYDDDPPDLVSTEVTSTPLRGDTYGRGETVELTARFSDPVTPNYRPIVRFVLENTDSGGNTVAIRRYAVLSPGSANTELVAKFNVIPRDIDADGISVASSPFDVTTYQNVKTHRFEVGGASSSLNDLAAHKVDGRINNRAPDAPTDLGATATRSHFDLAWMAPTWTGTSDITGYRIEYSADNGVTWATLKTSTGSTTPSWRYAHTQPGGTTLHFRVSTINVNGVSAPSNVAHAAVPPGVSSVRITSNPPVGDTYYRGETIEAKLQFDREVVVGGNPLMSLTVGGGSDSLRSAKYVSGSGTNTLTFQYEVKEGDLDSDGVSIRSSNTAGTVGLVGAESSITDRLTGLAADRSYTGLVNVSNQKVNGAVSPIPGAPTNLTASATSSTFMLNWLAPAHEGSSAIQHYTIDYSEDDGTTWKNLAVTSSLSHTHSHSAAAASTWQFRVSATNNVYTGPESAVVSATVPPRITSVSVTSTPFLGDTYYSTELIELQVQFNRRVVVGPDETNGFQPRLSVIVGTHTVHADYVRGSGRRKLTFRFKVEAGHFDDDGIEPFRLVSGTIKDRLTEVAVDRTFTGEVYADHKVNGLERSPELELSLSSSTVTEGDADGVTATVSIVNDERFISDFVVRLTWGSGSLGEGRFSAGATSIRIPAGGDSGSLTVVAAGEDAYHPPDTRPLVATYQGSEIGRVELTLLDNEEPPAVSIALSPTTVSEGDETMLTLSLTGAQSVYDFLTTTEKTDPTESVRSVSSIFVYFKSGETQKTIQISTDDDTVVGESRIATFTVAEDPEVVHYTPGTPSSVTLTIDDDDTPTWSVTAAPPEIAEATGVSIVTVSTGGVTFTDDKTITLNLAGSTAMAGIDFTLADDDGNTLAAPYALTLPAGAGSVTATVDALIDRVIEGDETVSIAADYDGAQIGTTQTVTITDDNAPTWKTGQSENTIGEAGGSSTLFVLSLGGVTFAEEQAIELDLTGSSATPGVDFTLTDGNGTVLSAPFRLTLPPGENLATVTITGVDDSVDEASEVVSIVFGHDGASAGEALNVTIADDDEPVWAVTSGPAEIAETAGVGTLTVSAGGVIFPEDRTFALDLSGSTATVGTDFTLADGNGNTLTAPYTLTLPEGASSVTATVHAANDLVIEGDEKVVIAVMRDSDQLGASQSVTITDDTQPTWKTGLSTDAFAEAGGTSGLYVLLLGGRTFTRDQTITLDLTGSTATEGVDVTVSGGDGKALSKPYSLTLLAGESLVTATLTGVDDKLIEGDEKVVVAAMLGGAQIGESQTATITDNDKPSWSMGQSADTIDEAGGSSTLFALSLGGLTFAEEQTIVLDLSGSTATAEVDYTLTDSDDAALSAPYALSLPAGENKATVTVTGRDDSLDEPDEVVSIAFALDDAQIGETQTLTIEDDEALPTVSLALSPSTIGEDGGVSTVTASLSGASSAAVTVTVSAAPVSPAVAGDYTLAGTSLTIAAGATGSTGTVTITANDDAVDAPDKAVTVSASVSGGHGVAAPADQTLTIEDDEASTPVTVFFGKSYYKIVEGPRYELDEQVPVIRVLIQVNLSAPPGREVRIPLTTLHGGDEVTEDDYDMCIESYSSDSYGANARCTDDTNILNGEIAASLTFTRAETRKAIVFVPVEDADIEGEQTVTLGFGVLPAGVSQGAYSKTVVKIVDNDIELRASDAEATEAEGATMDFTVTLEPRSFREVTVGYATEDGTAIAGDDYEETNGKLTFQSGETVKTISEPIIDDLVSDDGETFRLVLSGAQHAFLADAEAIGTIRNTEPASLAVRFPPSRFSSTRHTGTDDWPQVVVSFSDAVASFDKTTPSVSVTGAAVGLVQGHEEAGLANAWVFFVKPSGTSEVIFRLVADVGCDAGGICTADGSVLKKVPEARTIPGPAAATPVHATLTVDGNSASPASFPVKVAFSETVTGFEAANLTAGYVGGDAAPVTDVIETTAGQEWTARVTTAGTGRIWVRVGSVATADGRQSAPTVLTIDVDANGNVAVVVGPAVTAVTVAPATDGSWTSGDDVRVTLIFTEAVTVALAGGRPSVGVALDGKVRKAEFKAGSGTSSLAFAYRATVDDGTVNAATVTANSLALNEGTIRDAAGRDADLAHPGASGGQTAEADELAGEEDADTLTATFQDVPETHNGPDAGDFTFRVLFSEDVATGYKVLRDESFAVSGGTVKKAKRVPDENSEGRDDFREIHVEPTTWDAVTVTLAGGRACGSTGAVCTADNRVLSNTETRTIPGPLTLSVADARAEEGDDPTLDFVVTLNRASTETVTVDYATADGTATEPADYVAKSADYVAKSGKLSFAAGVTEQTVSVTVKDDGHNEEEETMTLVLSNPSGARIRDGEATGTIENSDPIPAAWLARFGRTVADHVVDAIGTRLTESSGGASHVTLGGQHIALGGRGDGSAPGADAGGGDMTLADEAAARDTLVAFADRISGASGAGDTWSSRQSDGTSLRDRSMTGRELLLGSSFVLNLSGDGEGAASGGTRWTAWGGAASSRFDGEAEGLSLDGDVTTFTLGADAAWSRWLAGVAVALSEGTGSYRDHADTDHESRGSGELESSLTSVHPYARLELSERLSLWGILGYGTGELEMALDSGERWTTDTTQEMAALGARSVLVQAPATGGLELGLRGDAVMQRMRSDRATGSDEGNLGAADVQTSRLRLALEGSRAFALEGGGRFTPGLEVGLRQDGGDAETGTGVEVGGGVSWTDPASGLTVEAKARTLVAHEDSDYREWGASGSVRLQPDISGLGLSLTLSPAWGAAEGGTERLWSAPDARDLTPDARPATGSRLEAEVGYGFLGFGGWGVMTPFAGLALSGTGELTWRTGVRWTIGPDRSLGLEAIRREPSNDDAAQQEFVLKAGARW